MRYHVRTIADHHWFDNWLEAKAFIDQNKAYIPVNDNEVRYE